MPSNSDLLSAVIFVSFYSTAIGACYTFTTQPGELLAFIPKWFYTRTKSAFLKKVSSCGKCVGGWTALTTAWFWCCPGDVFTIVFVSIISTAVAVVATGLINVYASSHT